ncbi:MAG: hypothetical protein JXQ75_24385 [Phycisphaerae bacterium]|nr:hypothetical protein [Phycisphaerae bacterium]
MVRHEIVLGWLALLLGMAAGARADVRVWTSVSGAKVTAEFVEKQGDFVVLRGENGKDLKIGLEKLSEADRSFVRELLGEVEPTPEAAEHPVGRIIKDVACEEEPEWSYLLYLPRAYKPDRKWPVLYILGPMGGSEYDVQRYVKGAELNGWILAMSTQRRNNFDRSGEAVRAMDHHVHGSRGVGPQVSLEHQQLTTTKTADSTPYSRFSGPEIASKDSLGSVFGIAVAWRGDPRSTSNTYLAGSS